MVLVNHCQYSIWYSLKDISPIIDTFKYSIIYKKKYVNYFQNYNKIVEGILYELIFFSKANKGIRLVNDEL